MRIPMNSFPASSLPSLLTAISQYITSPFLLDLLKYLALVLLAKIIPRTIPLRHRPIPSYDPDLDHPYLDNEQVLATDMLLGLTAIALPILLTSLFSTPDSQHPHITVSAAHHSLTTYIFSATLNELTTDTLKYTVRRLRPNFYAMTCHNLPVPSACPHYEYRLEQAYKSFPSGHASISFTAATLLTLHFLSRQTTHHPTSPTHRYLPPLTFYFIATSIAASRVVDHWHNPSDVLAGAIIGTASALTGRWFMHRNLVVTGRYNDAKGGVKNS